MNITLEIRFILLALAAMSLTLPGRVHGESTPAAAQYSTVRVEPRPPGPEGLPGASDHSPASTSPLQLTLAARLNATPRGFIPNVGQLPNDAVKFALRDSGVSAYFTGSGFVLWSGRTETISRDGMEMEVPIAPCWELVGARPVEPVGGDTFDHTISFFRGNDPSKWHANVPAYRNLRYEEVLSGVEMRVESRARGFEYSFHVQPHAKPDLHFRYDGITALESTFEGDLVVHTAKGHFTESRPIAFQWIDGQKHMVESAFEVVSTNEYRIALGSYDEAHELVVDPVLDWSTFLGKTYSENLRDIKVDQAGNIRVIGDTFSNDLPDTAGFSTGPGVYFKNGWFKDVFVAQFNSSGTELRWLGYLAGAGASYDWAGFGNCLALDSDGDLHIIGLTDSPDFPVTDNSSHAGGWDVFITKIKSDGSAILRSSLLGGTNDDYGWGIALDAQEKILITGYTLSGDFPTTLGAFDLELGGRQDAFVAKLDSSGALQWSSFLGGANDEERGAAILADANGDILVTGDTNSSEFPVTDGAFDEELGGANDAFIAKIHSDGSGIQWATFVGGSGLEHDGINQFSPIVLPRGDLALDSAGNILIAGQTLSTDFPGTAGSFQPTLAGDADGYVAKLTADGASLIWASYLGGSGGDQYQEIIWGITLNPWDEVFLIGRTDSPNFPVTPDAVQTSFPGGLQDGFLTKLSADGSQLLYSTYLGGSEGRDVLLGLAYDSGNVFVTGWSGSSSYPTTEGAYQTDRFGNADAVLLKFLDAFIAHDGEEFLVNGGVELEQSGPDVALNRNSEFVIAYDQLTVLDERVYPGDLFVRLYNPQGQAGEPIRVNDTTPGNPPSAAVALHDEGHFVVAWSGRKPEAAPPEVSEIYARRYDRAGSPLSEEIQVNTFVSGAHGLPDLAMDPQGNFVITWTQFRVRGQQVDQDGSGAGVFAQRYNKEGEPVGDEFQVNTITDGSQRVSKIAADYSGNFVVAWNSPDGLNADGSNSSGIFARLFDSSGAPRAPEFQVNEHTAGDQFVSGVAADGAGRIAILWIGSGPEADGGGVYVRVFDADGTAESGPMRIDPVNDQLVSSFPSAAMAMERKGSFVVTWDNSADQSIVGRVFNSRGEASSEIFRVNTSDGFRLSRAAVTLNEDGDLLVSWASFGQDAPDTWGVFARLLDVGRPTPLPPLAIKASAGSVRVSWPLTGASWLLEHSDALDSPAGWLPLPPPYEADGTGYFLTMPAADKRQFFRLRKP